MDEPRDDIDAWLSERVQPLLPAPGTFERVRREARRRRRRRAALAATATAAVVVAGAVVIPRLAGITLAPQPAASASHPGHHTPAPSPSPATGAKGKTVPGDFAPESVTFVGQDTGWVLGRADAGAPCSPSPATVCLARTDDRGKTWSLVNPPPTPGPDGGSGVSQIRFLNTSDGWAFGPQLWATHDGGKSWTQIPTNGMRVTALETQNGRAFAVWADCTGTGPRFAANCHTFTLWSTPAGSDQWAPVSGVGTRQGPGGAAASAQLVLAGTRTYFLPPDGVLAASLVTGTGTGAWQAVTGKAVPCLPGPAQPDGQPSQAMLASNGTRLVLLCVPTPGTGSQPPNLYSSSDGGRTWTWTGHPQPAGTPTSLSATPSGDTIVMATTRGIEVSTDGGVSWQPARGAAPPGGFAYLGMTTARQGVAAGKDAGLNALWFTYDGGIAWTRSPLG